MIVTRVTVAQSAVTDENHSASQRRVKETFQLMKWNEDFGTKPTEEREQTNAAAGSDIGTRTCLMKDTVDHVEGKMRTETEGEKARQMDITDLAMIPWTNDWIGGEMTGDRIGPPLPLGAPTIGSPSPRPGVRTADFLYLIFSQHLFK